jgi:predicted RNA-binding protein (TIGR00451 family)
MYRRADREELTILKRAFNKWGIFDLLKEKTLLIREVSHNTREVYLLSTALEPIILTRQPSYAGLKIGELKKRFLPTMQAADLIARFSKKFPYIVVNPTAEKLILYGRDVLGESILESTKMLNENQIVIILNANREPIAIGKSKFSGKCLLQKGKITVITVVDAGYYLRSEGRE